MHHYVLSCTTTNSRAPLRNLMHFSCTIVHHSYYSRAPLVLVHHYVISCTSRAPLHTLVHYSRVPLVFVHHSIISCTTRAPLLLVHLSFSCTPPYSCTSPYSCKTRTRAPLRNLVHYLCTTTYFRAPISCTTPTRAPLVHSSRAPLGTCAPLHTLVHPSRAPLRFRAPLVHHYHYFCLHLSTI